MDEVRQEIYVNGAQFASAYFQPRTNLSLTSCEDSFQMRFLRGFRVGFCGFT